MIRMTEEEFIEHREGNIGICLYCLNEKEGCEPDASKEICDHCDRCRVYGIEELLVKKLIEIIDQHAEQVQTRTEQLTERLRQEWKNKPR